MSNNVIDRYNQLRDSYKVSSKRKLSHTIRLLAGDGKYIKRIKEFRWKGNNIECPFCKRDYVREFKEGDRFKCGFCKKIFSIKVNTPLQGSRLSLEKWFEAIAFLQQDKDISSVKLSQQLKITQKTAWLMMQRLKTFDDGRYLEMNVEFGSRKE